MQQQLLTRLKSLAEDRKTATVDYTIRLLGIGIYGTLKECEDLGVGTEAWEILKKYQLSKEKV